MHPTYLHLTVSACWVLGGLSLNPARKHTFSHSSKTLGNSGPISMFLLPQQGVCQKIVKVQFRFSKYFFFCVSIKAFKKVIAWCSLLRRCESLCFESLKQKSKKKVFETALAKQFCLNSIFVFYSRLNYAHKHV